MKKIFLILLLTSTLCSCEKWFDVQPKTEVKLDKMLNTENGFKNALIGAYILIAEPQLYGRNMNVTFMDVIAQQYEMKDENNLSSAKRYDYLSNKSTIDNFWGKSYNAIANLNAIIGEIEGRKSVLHPTAYGYIKGEALGLRAFLHFDLLRMFGPGGLASRADMLKSPSIPYVMKYDKSITRQSTVEEVLKLIEADLLEAEKLLEYYDQYNIVSKQPDFVLPSDLFFKSSRKSRFNYLAVKATQARLYSWWGKYEEALNATYHFVNKENQKVGWVNIDRSINGDIKERDYKLTTEQIFRLDVFKFYENIKPNTEYYKITGNFTTSENNQYFFHSQQKAEQLYESSTIGISDFRFTKFYNRELGDFTFLKLYESEYTDDDFLNKMPLIRKSEMFYIAAECHMRKGNIAEAVRLLNEVRVNRGIKYTDNLPNDLSPEKVKEEIEKEYRKEFIAEGVMFFYYKRLNEAIPNSQKAAEDNIFIFPMPASEVEIGNRIEIVETL